MRQMASTAHSGSLREANEWNVHDVFFPSSRRTVARPLQRMPMRRGIDRGATVARGERKREAPPNTNRPGRST